MRFRARSISTVTSASLGAALAVPTAFAQLEDVPELAGGGGDLRTTILEVLQAVLNFMALVAVVFVVVAGIRLVISQGDEGQKDAAKKTIVYVIVGLVIIVLASAIVGFIIDALTAA
jgi:type IV secretory pathway VirB2 component (pilin)